MAHVLVPDPSPGALPTAIGVRIWTLRHNAVTIISTSILASMLLAQLSGGAPFRVERLDAALDDVIAQDAGLIWAEPGLDLTAEAIKRFDAAVAAKK